MFFGCSHYIKSGTVEINSTLWSKSTADAWCLDVAHIDFKEIFATDWRSGCGENGSRISNIWSPWIAESRYFPFQGHIWKKLIAAKRAFVKVENNFESSGRNVEVWKKRFVGQFCGIAEADELPAIKAVCYTMSRKKMLYQCFVRLKKFRCYLSGEGNHRLTVYRFSKYLFWLKPVFEIDFYWYSEKIRTCRDYGKLLKKKVKPKLILLCAVTCILIFFMVRIVFSKFKKGLLTNWIWRKI